MERNARYEITETVRIYDYRDVLPKMKKGSKCFIIGENEPGTIEKRLALRTIIKLGFSYYHIYGAQSKEWRRIIYGVTWEDSNCEILTSDSGITEFMNELIGEAFLRGCVDILIISDDPTLSQFLGAVLESTFDLRKEAMYELLEEPLEFEYEGKDYIVYKDGDVWMGSIGEERRYNTMEEALSAPAIDGKTFFEVWDETDGINCRIPRTLNWENKK